MVDDTFTNRNVIAVTFAEEASAFEAFSRPRIRLERRHRLTRRGCGRPRGRREADGEG